MDGSGWEGVYQVLKEDGYNVSIVQNPTISLEDDVAVTKRVLAAQDGPAILVGHSYGGAVSHRSWKRSQGCRARVYSSSLTRLHMSAVPVLVCGGGSKASRLVEECNGRF